MEAKRRGIPLNSDDGVKDEKNQKKGKEIEIIKVKKVMEAVSEGVAVNRVFFRFGGGDAKRDQIFPTEAEVLSIKMKGGNFSLVDQLLHFLDRQK